MPADFLDLFAPLRKGAELRGRVVSVHPETPDAATLLIKPGADWAGHVPGQYLRIGLDVDGVRQWRAYSLTHGPRPDGLISITVKAVPDGLVSHHLVHDFTPGTLVHLEQAQGEFVLPGDGGKLLFITAGSGITPVIGMLRNLFPSTDSGVLRPKRSADYDIVVLHVAPSRPDSIFRRDLQALARRRRDPARRAVRRRARPPRPRPADGAGARPRCAHDVTAADPRACSTRCPRTTSGSGSSCSPNSSAPPRIAPGEGGTVTFARNDTVVEAAGDTPILDASEAAGVLMPSGCRMGICYGCVLPLKEGSVRDLRNGVVTTAVPGEGPAIKIQTCIHAAAGDCHLDH